MALFWVESSPLRWNRIARTVATRKGLDLWQNARLFGLPVAWSGTSPKFVFRVESFYRGLYQVLRNLAADATQMTNAQARFSAGTMVWHE